MYKITGIHTDYNGVKSETFHCGDDLTVEIVQKLLREDDDNPEDFYINLSNANDFEVCVIAESKVHDENYLKSEFILDYEEEY